MKPVNPFYETTESVRQVLSEKYNHGMNNISKYKKEKVLTIADALEKYLGDQQLMTSLLKCFISHPTIILT